MDDLQCIVRGFHTKHVADVQKLADVQILEIIRAGHPSKKSHFTMTGGGVCLIIKTLCTLLMHFPFENWIQDTKVSLISLFFFATIFCSSPRR
jgi:hypothetical protein